ncbi:MAG: deoxynucleoside kinase [Pseudomonadota bacterium]
MDLSYGETMFVGIEGLDGVGKTTIIPLVVEKLKSSGIIATIKPEFPTGRLDVEFRAALNKGLFLAQHLQMPAAAAYLYLLHAEVISVHSIGLANTDVVVADRCHITHAIYQGYFTSPNHESFSALDFLRKLENLLSDLSVPTPDFIILLDATVDDVLPRLSEREDREITNEETAILNRFHSYYDEIARARRGTVIRISSTGTPESVAVRVTEAIARKFSDNEG